MDDQRLDGKRALVCGSTQGIGRACATELARRGAAVTLLARDAAALRTVVAELPAAVDGAHGFLCADFADTATLREQVAGCVADSGGFHVLINNTGGPAAGPVFEATPEAFEIALRMHVIANQVLVQALVPGMKDAHYGRIINIVSTSVREPIPNLGVSNTTRAAVAGWAKTLARELGPFQITVNNILPGFTDTGRLAKLIEGNAGRRGVSEQEIIQEMYGKIPFGRFARPEEVAAVAGFLASPAASYTTGVSLPVDGGRMASI